MSASLGLESLRFSGCGAEISDMIFLFFSPKSLLLSSIFLYYKSQFLSAIANDAYWLRINQDK